jgi:hypothetical protein
MNRDNLSDRLGFGPSVDKDSAFFGSRPQGYMIFSDQNLVKGQE